MSNELLNKLRNDVQGLRSGIDFCWEDCVGNALTDKIQTSCKKAFSACEEAVGALRDGFNPKEADGDLRSWAVELDSIVEEVNSWIAAVNRS